MCVCVCVCVCGGGGERERERERERDIYIYIYIYIEVSDTITRVRVLDRRSGAVHWVPGGDLGFGYRTSVLRRADGLQTPSVVLEVEFALDESGRSAPLRYGELRAALNASSGERADPKPSARRCWRCTRSQGHGARRG